MSQEKEKKGFWSIFRNRSTSQAPGPSRRGSKLEKYQPLRRASDGDVIVAGPTPRRRRDGPARDATGARRRVRRPHPDDAKGKGREAPNGRAPEPGPLTEWPPEGISQDEELSLGHAMEMISRGVPAFKGHKRPVPHASDHYYTLYATAAGNKGNENDAANQHDSMTQLMTLCTLGSGPAQDSWDTLEQPSYSFCYGKWPGTITLTHWVGTSSMLPPVIALRDPGVVPRDIDLARIFERLRFLERGLEDDNEDLMYRNLYRRLLRDPDRASSPHRTLDKQITDLIVALSAPGWLDFTVPKNQIVTRFFFDTSPANHEQYRKFFHQLLLSLELDLRINSRQHSDLAKEKVLLQLPPKVQWSLALSRRWRDYVRVEAYGKTADQVRLRFKLQRRQVKMLKRFAQMMKWPNLADTLDALKQRDADGSLDSITSYATAFFSGLVLPGPTFPFLMMNSLIDIDPDRATDDLALLTHIHPSCGFQYRNSYTYWTSYSIVGKVLAPTCHDLAGWVGPARPTVDLGRSQIARIRSRRPRERLTPEDALSMGDRSDPLGPPTAVFPVKEYSLVAPDTDDAVDTIRIELLSLRPVADGRAASDPGPRWFDASIQFAIDGVSWPLRLAFDVSFVCAWPCSDGPHPLFFDYGYLAVKADEIVQIKDWAGLYKGIGSRGGVGAGSRAPIGGDSRNSAQSPTSGGGGGRGGSAKSPAGESANRDPGREDTSATGGADDGDEEEKVLVIEAFGVPDNEVLARAWCSHWGLSAVVADIKKTCMACAIREAYAATITAVILVEDRDHDLDDYS